MEETARAIAGRQVYLERMAKPLQDKLRIARYLPPHSAAVLDAGYANDYVICALAALFQESAFLGIDPNNSLGALEGADWIQYRGRSL